jgi:hypothetical protein
MIFLKRLLFFRRLASFNNSKKKSRIKIFKLKAYKNLVLSKPFFFKSGLVSLKQKNYTWFRIKRSIFSFNFLQKSKAKASSFRVSRLFFPNRKVNNNSFKINFSKFRSFKKLFSKSLFFRFKRQSIKNFTKFRFKKKYPFRIPTLFLEKKRTRGNSFFFRLNRFNKFFIRKRRRFSYKKFSFFSYKNTYPNRYNRVKTNSFERRKIFNKNRLFNFRVSRSIRSVRRVWFLKKLYRSKQFRKLLRSRHFVKVVQTYNNFFIHFGNSITQRIYFSYSVGRVPILLRNRRKTMQTLKEAAKTFGQILKIRHIGSFHLLIVGSYTYFIRKFFQTLKSSVLPQRFKIEGVFRLLRRSHNGLRVRSSRRV